MRKNYLFLFILLIFSSVVVGQKVTLTPTIVNGVSYSSGAINLGSTSISTISLSIKVEFPADPGNNGTINVYYEKATGLGSIIPPGGNGGSLFFGGGKIGLSSFIISLNSAQFNTSGGYIYAEYKSSTGVAYKSSTISVIKNGTVTPPNPTTPSEYPIQSVPYGGTPLLPQYVYNTDYGEIQSQEWVINDVVPFEGANDKKLYIAGPNTLKQKTTLKNGDINYSSKITARVVNFLPELESLYIDNNINSNQYLKEGEVPQTIIGNQATESHSVRIEGTRRNQTFTNPLYNYQWQTRTKYPLYWFNFGLAYFNSYGWNDIPGATQINYTPPITNSGMEYRRLILENPLSTASPESRRCASSNVISVVPIKNDTTKNIICCDQIVSSGDLAIPITGDHTDNYYFQWQVSENNINWEDIFGANNRNYTPVRIERGGRRGTTNDETKEQFYRRIAFNFSDNKHYSSNIIKIAFESRSTTINQSIQIYPNPTTSILNIENTRLTQTMSNIRIIDQTGNQITPNSNSVISSNLIQLNVSNLPPGIYFLNMLVTAVGSTRGYTHQTTFIKQ
jgi:hypothetical protein